jgi:hypothetical protein
MTTATPARPARQRARLTPAERDARRDQDRERLAAAVRELRTSDGWLAWLNARQRFHRYSAQNCMLIAMQKPEATRVAPLKVWNQLGRRVLRGERAIAINVYKGSFAVEDSNGDEKLLPRFQLRACLFDISQTDGDELPEPPREPITGDSHARHLNPLMLLAGDLGYDVRLQMVPGTARGYCDTHNKIIVVEDTLPANAQVRVLIHEIAHALGIGYAEHGRARAEVLVESITYIVCGSIGLDTSGESVPYVAGWDDDDLETLEAFAHLVDISARTIEDVVLRNEDPTDRNER